MRFFDLLLPARARARVVRVLDVFVVSCPPPDKAIKVVSPSSIEKSLAILYENVAEIASEYKFGVIRRASIAKLIQDNLLTRGYPPAIVGKVTNAITTNALVIPRH
jgi:hypothetical protein